MYANLGLAQSDFEQLGLVAEIVSSCLTLLAKTTPNQFTFGNIFILVTSPPGSLASRQFATNRCLIKLTHRAG